MAKKSTKTILAALKRLGLEIEDLDKVTTELDDLELSADEMLGPDQMLLAKDDYRELKDDLTKLRKRAKDAEAETKDLRDAMDSGDSDNARKAKSYKDKLDKLEPITNKLLEDTKARWTDQAKLVPEALQAEFKVAKEGEELSTDDILANARKFEEYKRIGAIDPDAEPKPEADPPAKPDAVRVPASQKGHKLTPAEMDKMSPAALMEASYGNGKQ
jgi:hypothetical protein